MSDTSLGKFLTIEGTEGVGKSTNLEFIKSKLIERGVDVVVTREPGGTPLAEEIRETLLQKRSEKVDPTAELLLVFAARAQHLDQVIKPAIERGAWVLCDRFTDATFAYQGYGRGLSLENILQLETMVQKGLHPDATFYLDIDVEVGLERARKRAELDRFEEEQIEFFERVRKGYLARVDANPSRYFCVDAGQTLEKVQQDINACIEKLF